MLSCRSYIIKMSSSSPPSLPRRPSFFPYLLRLPLGPSHHSVQSLLSWPLALGLLTFSGYHYLRLRLASISSRSLLLPNDNPSDDPRDEGSERTERTTRTSLTSDTSWTPSTVVPLTTLSHPELSLLHSTSLPLLRSLFAALATLVRSPVVGNGDLRTALRGSLRARKIFTVLAGNVRANRETPREFRDLLMEIRRSYPTALKLPCSGVSFSPSVPPPTPLHDSHTNPTFLSLVVPCYNEEPEKLWGRLLRNVGRCERPSGIEIVVVDAGGDEGREGVGEGRER
mgnify:CR=1 FL=1